MIDHQAAWAVFQTCRKSSLVRVHQRRVSPTISKALSDQRLDTSSTQIGPGSLSEIQTLRHFSTLHCVVCWQSKLMTSYHASAHFKNEFTPFGRLSSPPGDYHITRVGRLGVTRERCGNVFPRPAQRYCNALKPPPRKMHMKVGLNNYMFMIQSPSESEQAMGMAYEMVCLTD
ncbi:hypothetical protein RU03_21330 [Pseudomonas simiae]|nr:hypothetical protein RU03_21330 [Pseudomonas simiae]